MRLLGLSQVWWLLALRWAVALSPYEDEKRATRALFDENRDLLASTLVDCEGAQASEAKCRRAMYVKWVNDQLEKALTPPPSDTDKFTVSNVKTVDESYQSLFENYIVKGIPFKGNMGLNSSVNNAMLMAISACGQHAEGKDNFPLVECSDADVLRSVIQIPFVAYNSYNVRLMLGNSELASGGDDGDLNPIASQWPSLVYIPPLSATSLHSATPHSCPASMHALLWGGTGSVTARLYSRHAAAHTMSPSVGKDELHELQYQPPSGGVDLESLHVDVHLSNDHEFLFVPHDYLFSFAQLQDGGEAAFMLQLCFFDASNINYVRESLGVAARLLDTRALHALSSLQSSTGNFDFNMTRKPPMSFFSLDEYSVYPRSFQSSMKTEIESDDAVPLKGRTRGRDRSKGNANNFRDWQDTNKWNAMVMSLTLPQLVVPKIYHVGRSDLTLQWTSDYFPTSQLQKHHDTSASTSSAGFNLTVCSVSAMANALVKGLLDGASSKQDAEVEGCVVKTFSSQDLASIAVTSSTVQNDEVVQYIATVAGLNPDEEYKARVSLYYENAGGHPSPWTVSAFTLSRTVPAAIQDDIRAVASESDPTAVYLNFQQPKDDGGRSIVGYHIYARHIEQHLHHTEWVWHSSVTVGDVEKLPLNMATVSHLLPQTLYEFQLSSFNDLGNSSLSSISSSVSTSALKRKGVSSEIFGVRHKQRLGGASIPFVEQEHTAATHVTVDDDAQILTVFVNDSLVAKYDVWDCHWSPRLFRVTSEVVWAVPPLADRNPVSDPDYCRGKIVVAQRGAVSIATKAFNLQKLGAIAAIILDNEEGLCEYFDQRCVAGADKSRGERFALHDHPSAWIKLKIPVLLLKYSDSVSFLDSVDLPPGMGGFLSGQMKSEL